jgi:Domain of unknown function (DUF6089)
MKVLANLHRSPNSLLKAALVLVLAVGFADKAHAQYTWDFGLNLSASNYLGDIGGKEKPRRDFIWDMRFNQSRWNVGVFGRRKFNRLFSANAGLNYLRIQGSDGESLNRARVGRNLNFRNDMFEIYGRGEVSLFHDADMGGIGKYKKAIRIYGFAGVSGFYHSPKGRYLGNGPAVNLRDLGTEGVSYSSFGVAIPAGLGVHLTMKKRHRIGFELNYRTTFTDYLDDVSNVYADPAALSPDAARMANQYVGGGDVPAPVYYDAGQKRGDATRNDGFLTVGFTYSYVMRGQSSFYRQRYSWVKGKKRIGRKSRAKF